jgi:hypothetical protein
LRNDFILAVAEIEGAILQAIASRSNSGRRECPLGQNLTAQCIISDLILVINKRQRNTA